MTGDANRSTAHSPFEVISGEGEAAVRAERARSALESVALFRDLTREQLAMVARLAREASAVAGEVIVREGEAGDQLLVVVEGTVRVERGDRELTRMGPGEYFGEISLLDGGPRTATIVAESPVTLVSIGKQSFDHLMDTVPDMRERMILVLCARLRNVQPDLVG
jgi:CRP-like cAMP-binding protein